MTTVFPGWKLPNVYNHEPPDYICPFCKVVAGLEDEASYTVASDIVLRTNLVIGFISWHWWPRNPGHVILIPWDHYENIYDLPETCGTEIYRASREIGPGYEGRLRLRRHLNPPAQ